MADQPNPAAPVTSAPTLVGREHEQAALRAALDRALAGRGSLILICGEAGIGKTALAEWLLAEAATQGALALVGRCYDLSETPPTVPGPRHWHARPAVMNCRSCRRRYSRRKDASGIPFIKRR